MRPPGSDPSVLRAERWRPPPQTLPIERQPPHRPPSSPAAGRPGPHCKAGPNTVKMAQSRPRTRDRNAVAPRVYPDRSRIAETGNTPGRHRLRRIPHALDDLSSRTPADRKPPPAGWPLVPRQLIPMKATSSTLTDGDQRAVRFVRWLNTVQRADPEGDIPAADHPRPCRPGRSHERRNRFQGQCPPFAAALPTNPVTDSRSTTRKRRRVTSHGSGHTPCTQDGFTVSPFQRPYRSNDVERKRCPEQPRSAVPRNDHPGSVRATWFSSEKSGHESQRYPRTRQRAMSQSS